MKSVTKILLIGIAYLLFANAAGAAESMLPESISIRADNGSFQVALNIVNF
ncbi:hypothetical protein G6726_06110 [Polynucleobacter paneuropaeus]|jgi:hypothetical protein|nr:hypothetical protein [Polynucleobacter paneuropaeus]MBT8576335.1 hypothetical protein [Polynucleobacter paneuropaeus]QWD01517.1 hypothetical protein G6726_06110 [Polynucleobacter paneuropaeus]